MKIKTNFTLKTLASACLIALALSSCGQSSEQEEKTETEQKAKVKAPQISIHDAVVAGNLEAVKQHIAAKTDLNQKDPFGGSSPLILASVFGKNEIAKTLIDAGVKLDQKNNDGSTALISAAFFCRTEMVQMLLDAGADKSIKNNYGSTALDNAVIPFKDMEPIYKMMQQQLGAMGLQIDLAHIEATRPQIAQMLQ